MNKVTQEDVQETVQEVKERALAVTKEAQREMVKKRAVTGWQMIVAAIAIVLTTLLWTGWDTHVETVRVVGSVDGAHVTGVVYQK